MDPPICRACGKRHWSRVCNDAALHATKPFVPDVPRLVAPSKLAALVAENEALTAEVAMLKKKLAGRPPKSERAMTATERSRKRRVRLQAPISRTDP